MVAKRKLVFPSMQKRKKVKSLIRRRKRVIIKGAVKSRKEANFVDTATANYNCDTTGTVTLLNGVSEGDDNTQRNGRRAKFLSVQMHGAFTTAAGNPGVQKVRALLVWDNAPEGVIATVAQILSATSSFGFPLIDNNQRFTILSDKSEVLGPNVTTATQAYIDQSVKDYEIYRSIESSTVFNGTGATIASIQNGALYLVTVGDLVAGATAAVLTSSARVRFLDE